MYLNVSPTIIYYFIYSSSPHQFKLQHPTFTCSSTELNYNSQLNYYTYLSTISVYLLVRKVDITYPPSHLYVLLKKLFNFWLYFATHLNAHIFYCWCGVMVYGVSSFSSPRYYSVYFVLFSCFIQTTIKFIQ